MTAFARRPSHRQLFAVLMLVGCTSPPPAPHPSDEPEDTDQHQANTQSSDDIAAVRAVLAACSGEETVEGWVKCSSAETCYVSREGAAAICCEFNRGEVQVSQDDKQGTLEISGTLVCSRQPAQSSRVAVFATTTSWRAQHAVSELARIELRPDAVDPVPLFEDFRIPFVLSITPEGLSLLPKDERGERRLQLLGLVTSQDGPAVAAFLRFSF